MADSKKAIPNLNCIKRLPFRVEETPIGRMDNDQTGSFNHGGRCMLSFCQAPGDTIVAFGAVKWMAGGTYLQILPLIPALSEPSKPVEPIRALGFPSPVQLDV
ncbi:hypothetical protein T265_09122 [Opisthorchis viverrini]|uniref:Uncharacterized protein n=1 Tax=Opisthorchis viverrini TaxID=6198 RepID=A0A074ZHU0_OPIVI|nr:hypothetical protein T265_09122 [Opisthorchis viverrini]KER22845.1 hypothetical protein T265_09122 [Opisthorchis viverrini]